MALYLGSDKVSIGGFTSIIPSGYILPSGIHSITTNGIYDITNYASVDVNISGPTGTYSINANGLYDIASYASVDVTIGATDIEDALVMHTLSGVYSNSRITKIGPGAFYSCYSLVSVNFPNVTSIGSFAFQYCSNLTTVSFSTTVSSMGGSTFQYCHNLVTFSPLDISSTYQTFMGCSKLTTISSINLPNITTIGYGTFRYCSNLQIVELPLVSIIGGYAFAGCYSLTTVSFPEAIRLEYQAFVNCSHLTNTYFPKVEFISGNATFSSCWALSELSFPKLNSISGSVFAYCYNLISLNLTGVSSVPVLSGTSAFYSTPIGGYSASAGQYGSIYVPASLYDSFIIASNWSSVSSRIVSV